MLKFTLSSFLFCIGIMKIFGQAFPAIRWDALRQEFNKDSTEMILSDSEGVLQGKHKISFPDGSYGLFDISNGKINGKAPLYNHADRLESIFFYNNGLRNGTNENYDEHGGIWLKQGYLKGKKHGIESTWAGNLLISSVSYQTGLKHGTTKYYHDGILITESEYLDGKKNGIERNYNLDGNLITETDYINDKINGLYKTFMPDNGHLWTVTEFRNNLRDGKFVSYIDGKQKMEQQYKKGLRHGLSKLFDQDEKVIVTNYFWKDKKISKEEYDKLLESKDSDYE